MIQSRSEGGRSCEHRTCSLSSVPVYVNHLGRSDNSPEGWLFLQSCFHQGLARRGICSRSQRFPGGAGFRSQTRDPWDGSAGWEWGGLLGLHSWALGAKGPFREFPAGEERVTHRGAEHISSQPGHPEPKMILRLWAVAGFP